MPVEIVNGPFDPWQRLANHEARGGAAGSGATAVFVGTMRDFNEGDQVTSMTLEHYPGMTDKQLEQICAGAAAARNLLETLVIHRVGEIRPGQPIVLVAVWSHHRREAFDACREIMEALKSRAPFWKKETLPNGQRWVDRNTPG